MLKTLFRATPALAALAFAAPHTAAAHAIAGVRVFPVTLTLDDPGVADEATLPQIAYQPEPGQSQLQFQWEYDKTITPDTALIYNHGYDIYSVTGAKRATGFENVVLTGKWQAWVVPEREFLLSLGVQREFAGDGHAVANGIADAHGSTAPTVYFGKGLGDLPIGVFRPLAVTGELSYVVPDRKLNSDGSNNGSVTAWNGGLSLQYSLPYLQSQVKDYDLPDVIGRLIPLVELNYNSPAAGPAVGNPTLLSFAAGAIWLGDTYQVGLEAVIPGNRNTGKNIGYIAQVHYFFDDIFPNTLGKPLFP